MASKDDDNTLISSPTPGPPQDETPTGTVQSPTPRVYPPSQTISITPPPLMIPPPSRPQNPAFSSITEQKRQSSWDPSMPHAQRRSPELNHQEMLIPITSFMRPRSLSGSFSDTSADDAGVTENRNAGATWGPANSQVSPAGNLAVRFDSALPSAHPISTEKNRRSSWDLFMSYDQRRRPDLNDQGIQRSKTPFIPPLSTPSGSFFDTSNSWAGVSNHYRNSGQSPAIIPTQGPPANDRMPTSYAGAALRYNTTWAGLTPGIGMATLNDGVHNAGATWSGLTPGIGMATLNDGVRNAGATWSSPTPGIVMTPQNDGVRNAGATWSGPTPGIGMTPQNDRAVTSTHPITNPSWTVHVYSQRLQITGERLRRYQVVRSKLRFESQLNDLFSG